MTAKEERKVADAIYLTRRGQGNRKTDGRGIYLERTHVFHHLPFPLGIEEVTTPDSSNDKALFLCIESTSSLLTR